MVKAKSKGARARGSKSKKEGGKKEGGEGGDDGEAKPPDKKYCKSCGLDTHQRRSSILCPNRIIPNSKRNKFSKIATETFTIKMGFTNCCPNDRIRGTIDRDVDLISEFLIELSILFECGLRVPNSPLLADLISRVSEPNFLFVVQALYTNTRGEEPYLRQMPHFDWFCRYDNTLKTNILNQAVESFQTNVKTNLTTHAFTRVRRYITKFCDKTYQESVRITRELFHENKIPTELGGVFVAKNWSTLNFREYQSHWWKFLEFFQELQRLMPTLQLTPIYDCGLKHVLYTSSGFHELLVRVYGRRAMGYYQDWSDDPDRDINRDLWGIYMNIPMKPNQVFSGSISTNGVDISIHYLRPKRDSEAGPSQQRPRWRAQEYTRFIGLDPGLRSTFGGIFTPTMEISNNDAEQIARDTRFLHSSAAFRLRAGQISRKKKLDAWTLEIRQWHAKMQQEEGYRGINYDDPNQWERVTHYRLKWFRQAQPVYAQRKIVRLSWDSKIQTQREIDNLVNYIVYGKASKEERRNTRTFIALGQVNISPYMRGYVRVPLTKIAKRLYERKDNVTIVNVDEYYTTQLCSKCNRQCIIGERKHRYVYCPFCHITFNRDINAGRNILYLGLIRCGFLPQNAIPRFDNFTRQVRQ